MAIRFNGAVEKKIPLNKARKNGLRASGRGSWSVLTRKPVRGGVAGNQLEPGGQGRALAADVAAGAVIGLLAEMIASRIFRAG